MSQAAGRVHHGKAVERGSIKATHRAREDALREQEETQVQLGVAEAAKGEL